MMHGTVCAACDPILDAVGLLLGADLAALSRIIESNRLQFVNGSGAGRFRGHEV